MLTIIFSMLFFLQMHSSKTYSMLCLGDSYTIGESVAASERFPEQTIELLKQKNISFTPPEIIARTGWTTQNLLSAIDAKNTTSTYDLVTVLIGVNDQFQGKDTSSYAKNFETLLLQAIQFADGKTQHVIVLSIPDYGVTPFANYVSKNPGKISAEIDVFNAINKRISEKYKAHYIDITALSRKAKEDTTLLAYDGLHPSGNMYRQWAELLAEEIEKNIKI